MSIISKSIRCKLIILLSFLSVLTFAQTPAFPTAEGFGKWATGGRGGKVIEVTTIEDNGTTSLTGSLRWALNQFSGQPLTVVFRVSGIIDLKGVELRCKRNNLTIAGQTAPDDGICIKGESFNLGGSYNVIIRHLRFRTGAYTPSGVATNAASFIFENGGNFIIDHCSFSWSSEELCDIADDSNWTAQWCVFSEGLYYSVNSKGKRGYGPVIIGNKGSFHHNLLSCNVSRSPRFGVSTSVIPNILFDFVNNVNYNFGKSNMCYGGENEMGKNGTIKINFVNNYYKPGPGSLDTDPVVFVRASYEVGVQDTFYTKWHLSGNYIEGVANAALNVDNYNGLDIQEYKTNVPACTINNLKSEHHTISEPVVTETAINAFQSVTTKAGAYPLDTIDRRILREARAGTVSTKGVFYQPKVTGIVDKAEDAGGWPVYATYNTITDNDHDGMDDAWEVSNGLNPSNAEDRNTLAASGYTALEVYLNSLVGENIDFSTELNTSKQSKVTFCIQNNSQLKLYSHEIIKSVTILNATGSIVLFQKSDSNQLDIHSLNSGIYVLKVNAGGNKESVFRFLKK